MNDHHTNHGQYWSRSRDFAVALADPEMNDATIVLNRTHRFAVNTFMLSCLSAFFRQLLKGSFTESLSLDPDIEMEINDPLITADAFKQVIHWAYLQPVQINEENAVSLYYVAEVYDIKGLKEMAHHAIKFNLAIHPLKLLTDSLDTNMEDICIHALREINFSHGNQLVMSSQFEHLSLRALETLLANPQFHCSEAQMIKAVEKWVAKRVVPNSQMRVLKRLLPHIRFSTLQDKVAIEFNRSDMLFSKLLPQGTDFLHFVESRRRKERFGSKIKAKRSMFCERPRLTWKKTKGYCTKIQNGVLAEVSCCNGYLLQSSKSIPPRCLSYVQIYVENLNPSRGDSERRGQTSMGVVDASALKKIQSRRGISFEDSRVSCHINFWSGTIWNGSQLQQLGTLTSNLYGTVGLLIDNFTGLLKVFVYPSEGHMHETGWINCRQLARKEIVVFVNVYGDANCEIVHQEKLPIAVRQAINNDTKSLVRKSFPICRQSEKLQMINLDACELGDVSEQDGLRSKKLQWVISPNRMPEPTNESRQLLPQNPKWLVPKKKSGESTQEGKKKHQKSGPLKLDESFRLLQLSPPVKSKLQGQRLSIERICKINDRKTSWNKIFREPESNKFQSPVINITIKSNEDVKLEDKWYEGASCDEVEPKVIRSTPNTPDSVSVTTPSATEEPLTFRNLKNPPRTPSTTPSLDRADMREGSVESASSVDPYGSDVSTKEIRTMDEAVSQYPYSWMKSPNRPEVLSNPGTPDSSVVRSSEPQSSPRLSALSPKLSPTLRFAAPQPEHSLDNAERNRSFRNIRPLNTAAASFVPLSLPNIPTHGEVLYSSQHPQIFYPSPFLGTYANLPPALPVPRFVPTPLGSFIPLHQPTPYHEISEYNSSPLNPESNLRAREYNPDVKQNTLSPRSELKRKVMMQLKRDDRGL